MATQLPRGLREAHELDTPNHRAVVTSAETRSTSQPPPAPRRRRTPASVTPGTCFPRLLALKSPLSEGNPALLREYLGVEDAAQMIANGQRDELLQRREAFLNQLEQALLHSSTSKHLLTLSTCHTKGDAEI